MKKSDTKVPVQTMKQPKGGDGVSSKAMKQMGRNMARAMNQKHSGRGR